jgi:hypothetical protein
MITLAILSDKEHKSQRGRSAGKPIRKVVAICIDSLNVVLAGGNGTTLAGKKYAGRLAHLVAHFEEYGVDEEHARLQMIDFFTRFSGEPVDDLSWAEMDERFEVSKRRDRSSTGILVLYDQLRDRGWADDEPEVAEAAATA